MNGKSEDNIEALRRAEADQDAFDENVAEEQEDLDHAIDDAEQNIDVMQQELSDIKDRLLRAMADSENIRRRAEKEKKEASKFAITRFSRDLLGVADNFQRALASLTPEMRAEASEAVNTLIVGVEMTERELLSVFERHGITKVHPKAGEKFDPNLHQAIAEIPNEIHPKGSVVDVTQTGFAIEGRLLRPAMVTVSKNTKPAGPASSEGSSNEGAQDNPGEEPKSSDAQDTAPREPGHTINTTA